MLENTINGIEIAASIRSDLRTSVEAFSKESGVTPSLAVILIGDNPASAVYVRNKEKACAEVGITTQSFTLPASTTEQQLLELVEKLNSEFPSLNLQ